MTHRGAMLVLSGFVTAVFVAGATMVAIYPSLERAARPGQRVAQPQAPAPLLDFLNIAADEPAVEQLTPIAQADSPAVRGEAIKTTDYTISGPHTHNNLTVFLIHGGETMKKTNVVTLQEAIEQNVAIVHETGMGQLFIDNRGNAPLFIQAGDIVKGGTQDRTLPYDMLVSANTTRNPVTALCVEQGRSFPRGNEVSTSFGSATEQLPNRKLKLAAAKRSQAEVWQQVQVFQNDLTRNVGAPVQANLSRTSLQLTLENPLLHQQVHQSLAKLAAVIEGQADVIGFAVAINGKVHSADVYGSNALFVKLWPKLIRASAVEAVAERQPGAVAVTLDADSVMTFLAAAEQGQAMRAGANGTTVIRHDTANHLLLETCNPGDRNVVLHRSFLAK